MKTIIRLCTYAILVLSLGCSVHRARSYSSLPEEVQTAIASVARATSDLTFTLDVFSRSAREGDPLCSATMAEALEDGERTKETLRAQITRLESLIVEAKAKKNYSVNRAIEVASIRLSLFDDAKTWITSTGGDTEAVDWCKGFINCLVLRHGCNGCYKCYEGLTDCGCFTPADDIQGCS